MVRFSHILKAIVVLVLFGFVTLGYLLVTTKTTIGITESDANVELTSNSIRNKIRNSLNRFFTSQEILEHSEDGIDIVYTWVNGSDAKFLDDLKTYSVTEQKKKELAGRRFRDKNELRFSLRSIEKNAPWVNHVYIVTNGQVPYWLNRSYEKVTVISHDQIFRDGNNLPTFSSPAIESNLHKIPGISKRFIYFNDDVFLGQPLNIEDFYTDANGYKVFLAWAVPDCKSQCSWSKVKDGKCQGVCNNMECQYDGGDCSKDHTFPAYDSNKVKNTGIDGYGASLLHSQRLLNIRYGFKSRKVAAHAPIMIDRDIMNKLEAVYIKEFTVTESHRFRGSDDLQYGFIYYSFLMEERNNNTIDDIFGNFDRNNSSSWSDDEMTDFLITIDKAPPNVKVIEDFRAKIKQCSYVNTTHINSNNNKTKQDIFPTINKELITNCSVLRNYIVEKIGDLPKYKYELVKRAESTYSTLERLTSNVGKAKAIFKKLQSKPTKFICLNDDLDDSKGNDNKIIIQLLQNFYLAQFPKASSFEIAENMTVTITKLTTEDIDRHNLIGQLCFLILAVLLMPCFCVFSLRYIHKMPFIML